MNKFSGILIGAMVISAGVYAQKEDVPKGWHMMDKASSGYYGVSSDKAYNFIKSKKLKSKTVIVAVIDSGIDTLQEDLKQILWTNPKEIPGNGIDDDKNGYIDDVHGWNFIGGRDGRNVKEDSYEGARVYYSLKSKWADKPVDIDKLSAADKAEYAIFKKAEAKVMGGWLVISLLISPFISIIILLLSSDESGQAGINDGTLKNCYQCAEIVKKEAIRCKHCGAIFHDNDV